MSDYENDEENNEFVFEPLTKNKRKENKKK